MAYRKIYKILGVAEINNLQLEPERGMDMIEGEPERKRLALMGATAGNYWFGVFVPNIKFAILRCTWSGGTTRCNVTLRHQTPPPSRVAIAQQQL